ncbi:transcription termination factor Rho [Rhodococcus sp. HNM0569]|uniref:transcription termination factor Rho n=1 Tax=Rhodococcus sp. HNM0569 TaxID=2716340 RepID=UPI00146B413B|nr:transcription termination factor Rho [Rhodococcus sp. HNM0569]
MTDTELITSPVDAASANADDAGLAQTSAKAVTAATKRAEARRSGGLSGMVLAELRALAGELGIKGTSGMRKGDLIAAIKERQGGGGSAEAAPARRTRASKTEATSAAPAAEAPVASAPAPDAPTQTQAPDPAQSNDGAQGRRRGRRGANRDAETSNAAGGKADTAKPDSVKPDSAKPEQNEGRQNDGDKQDGKRDGRNARGEGRDGGRRGRNQNNQGQNQGGQNQGDGQGQKNDGQKNDGEQGGHGGNSRHDDDGGGGGRGRRGRRVRERRRGRDRDGGGGGDVEIREDDVLQPVAGILDVLDNYAFVRTSGYLPGPNDVYVSMNLIRKNGLRRGDAITGAVRVPREGEGGGNQRQKFNPLVRIDTVNGGDVDAAKRRPEFNKLTPLYPNQRLRLETEPNRLTTRVIDLVMPIGKGQRALIVSPPKAGKTTVLQDIANAIARNNPECHLMVVLVDERPEEVTDMQRSVHGEVIASTFDRPPSDHTAVAELAIERAKRLVEAGQDVVVLLDSITRLGRAYNNSSPASGRILSGGVDSTALYPPKRFLGAARNIENGGSLTIIASALVETGSTGDTVIFEEFKGTGNAELKLDRKIAERRVFPAVDVNASSTRKDELLMSGDEFAVVHKLRRVLSGLDSHQAIDLLVDRLKKSKSNVEFLMQVSKTAPGALDD